MQDPLINRLIRYPSSAMSRVRRWKLRLLGAHVGRVGAIHRISVPRNPWDIWLEDWVCLEDGVTLQTTGPRRSEPRIFISRATYINRYTMIDAHDRIELGENCMIGPFCYISDADHQHLREKPVNHQPMISAPVKIGKDVWLGVGVYVLKGVTIGEGAIVGAGAVVTRDLPAYCIAVGVPGQSQVAEVHDRATFRR